MPRVAVGLAELPDTPHFLYRLYDRTDTLLYIGITNDPKTRFKNHRKLKDWWSDVDQTKTRIDFHATRDQALAAEAKAIKAESPLYNDQHNLTIDTPLAKAIDAAKSEFAESVIKRLVSGPEAYEAILKEAADQIDEAKSDPDWPMSTEDPAVYGAALAAERSSGDVWHYKHAVELLLETLPVAQVDRCRARAIGQLNVEDYEALESEIVCTTADFLAEELGDEYLDGLGPEESWGWRRTARAMLHERAGRHYVVRHAAAYAKAFKANRWYEQASLLCMAVADSGAGCASKVSVMTYFHACPNCDEENCEGHLYWCERHFEDAREGRYRWRHDNSKVSIAGTSELSQALLEEAPF